MALAQAVRRNVAHPLAAASLVERAQLFMQCASTMMFVYFTYIGFVHNQDLPDPKVRYKQRIVNWGPALGFIPVVFAVTMLWALNIRQVVFAVARVDVLRLLSLFLASTTVMIPSKR